ncbi:hypothetical protein EV196_106139 [Mariniflexile fucanivorans]|uniref:DUF932 domain-containing protein n=1 Tax=Mariniflexile fucanivorans TaxID=264023 RepID=A0A4R1RGW0_9FLAO|nr:hypothetical protein [Mariniflexile fucanivorans]TCL64950.1 hypothetical protein EV196_106139 [Mariniflexile fucanivorans]
METRTFKKEEILNSKGYVKGVLSYPSPNQLFSGLFDIENDYNCELQGTHEFINLNEDKTENISFGRIHLNYNFKIDNELRYDLGLIVALDKGKPIAKIYSGVKVNACMNLCIFGAEQIIRFEISSTGDSYKDVFKNQFQHIKKNIDLSKRIIEVLKNYHLSHDKIQRLNGYILEEIIKNNSVAGTNPILNAIKLQSEKSSRYFANKGLNAWLYFNSLTEYLNEKIHPLDIPEKALNLFKAVEHIIKDYEININVFKPNQFLIDGNQIDLEENIKEIEIINN